MATRKWGTEILVNTTTTGDQDQSSITALADGGFMVAWRDANPAIDVIRMQRYDAMGNTVGTEFQPFEDYGKGTYNASLVDMVQLADGNLWFQTTYDVVGNGLTIDGQVVALGGANVRNQFIALAYNTTMGELASLGANGAAGVYVNNASTKGDVFLDIYDAAGGVVADDLQVNTTAASMPDPQVNPSVAANKAGDRLAVVWEDYGIEESAIRCRVFDNTGAEIAAEFNVTAFPPVYSDALPDVTWLDNNKFVVTWATESDNYFSTHGDGDVKAIKYAIFTAGGAALGSERLANTTTAGAQISPVTVALPDGGFAIAWTDESGTGSDPDTGTRLQVFDGAGNKRGDEILVNNTTQGFQGEPSIAALADGRIAVSWTDAGTNAEVRVQIIDPRDGIVNGTSKSDTLYGHDALGDVLSGYDGDDTLYGLNGTDVAHGGAGIDSVFGGRGDDVAYGGAGNDSLRGNNGEDQLFGEAGNDLLRGNNGDDELNGGASNDTLLGGAGSDILNGGSGGDFASYLEAAAGLTASLDVSVVLTGEAAGDTYVQVENLIGSNFDDYLYGNSAANSLDGRAGADEIHAGAGADRIIGGTGLDTLFGDSGNDTFVFNAPTDGKDYIADFSQLVGDNDRFELKGSGFGGGLVAGPLLASQFQDTGSITAADGNVRIIYGQAGGFLFFDVDGSGAAAPVLLATLSFFPDLELADFTIV